MAWYSATVNPAEYRRNSWIKQNYMLIYDWERDRCSFATIITMDVADQLIGSWDLRLVMYIGEREPGRAFSNELMTIAGCLAQIRESRRPAVVLSYQRNIYIAYPIFGIGSSLLYSPSPLPHWMAIESRIVASALNIVWLVFEARTIVGCGMVLVFT